MKATQERQKVTEETYLERELNLLMEMTLKMEHELIVTLTRKQQAE